MKTCVLLRAEPTLVHIILSIWKLGIVNVQWESMGHHIGISSFDDLVDFLVALISYHGLIIAKVKDLRKLQLVYLQKITSMIKSVHNKSQSHLELQSSLSIKTVALIKQMLVCSVIKLRITKLQKLNHRSLLLKSLKSFLKRLKKMVSNTKHFNGKEIGKK